MNDYQADKPYPPRKQNHIAANQSSKPHLFRTYYNRQTSYRPSPHPKLNSCRSFKNKAYTERCSVSTIREGVRRSVRRTRSSPALDAHPLVHIYTRHEEHVEGQGQSEITHFPFSRLTVL